MKKRNGAEILLDALYANGVEVIFGYPGAKTLKVHDALIEHPIKHVLVRHEQAAAHAADGYFRSTGKLGVCLTTSGPGATNLVTGIATAHMDSSGILALTCQVATGEIGSDAFQEADMVGITQPVTKHNYLVLDVNELEEIVNKAVYIATTGRPGPVLIDLPSDVLAEGTSFSYNPDNMSIRGYKPHLDAHPNQVKRSIKAIKLSKNPVIISGGGVIQSDCGEELTHFADKFNIPIVTTLMGIGAVPGDHPKYIGMIGMYGNWLANKIIHDADLIIAVGTRFSDRSTCNVGEFAPNSKIIHIDIDPASISKNINVDIPITGDAKNIIKKIAAASDSSSKTKWWKIINKIKAEYCGKILKNIPKPRAEYVLEELNRQTNNDAIIVTDVGSSQMWCASFSEVNSPRKFLTSGGLGTMGFALPAAMGAKTAHPKKQVIAVAGDGGALMNIQELATLVYYQIPVKMIIFENFKLGMVRQFQDLFLKKRYSSIDLGVKTDFVTIAKGFGVNAEKVEADEDFSQALQDMLTADTPFILVVNIPETDLCFPMIPPGAGNSDMICSP